MKQYRITFLRRRGNGFVLGFRYMTVRATDPVAAARTFNNATHNNYHVWAVD